MPTRNPTALMWAEACDLLEQADRMHRQFFRLAAAERARPVWEPPVDVFEDNREIIIVVALPGVSADRTEVTLEGSTLLIRAESRILFGGPHCEVRRLEIPYGRFERRIALPAVPLEPSARQWTDGCLILSLRKVT
jgi:HSP20 family molecular chaperone IbpA